MERRELLKTIALLTGGVVIGGEFLLSGCKTNAGNSITFSASDLAMLNEVGETIIPTTADSPGAKASKIGEFMQSIVKDCYTAPQQKAFTSGLTTLNNACKKANNKSFLECTPQQRKDFLISLEKEAKDFNKKVEEEENKKRQANKEANDKKPWSERVEFENDPRHYYTMMKQLTLWGYFSSEIGMTKALRHIPVPGKFDGNYPYKKGDKAWAE